MKKGLATIVLPVYNVEKYLERCINSVVNQTYKNLEIILVDDGSPDNCPQICEEWAKKDSRIQVIHKKNAGLGMARNTGIEKATGEYIFFFDSDDYVALDTVEKILSVANRTNADLIIYGHNEVDHNGRIKSTIIPFSEKEFFEGAEIQNNLLPDMVATVPHISKNGNIWMSACMIAYKASLIHETGFRFVSEREYISEDTYSLLCLMRNVGSVAVVPEAFYFYCENQASLTHTYRSDRHQKINAFYIACMKKCDEFGYAPVIKKRFASVYLDYVIATMKMIVKSNLSKKERKKNIDKIVHDDLMQQATRQINIRSEQIMRKLLLLAIWKKQSGLVYWMVKAKA